MKRMLTMILFAVTASAQFAAAPATASRWAIAAHASLPLLFEPYRGQTGQHADFLSRREGYTVFLSGAGAVLSSGKHPPVRITLLGANPAARAEGQEKLPSTSNYFLGNDPSKWRTQVPNFARVRYRNVYPGIDLVYYGNQQQMEHDFIVAPSADPRRIRFAAAAGSNFELEHGDLVIHVPDAEVRLRKPAIYQEERGVRRAVAGEYKLTGANRAGLALGPYDTSKPLVIDPLLLYSTYLGGSSTESSLMLTVDAPGNAYVIGQTNSIDFPAANPLQARPAGGSDSFIAKFTPDGSALVFCTYLGGTGDDVGRAIKVDSAANVYVAGRTASTDFPTTSDAWQRVSGGGPADAYVAKLSPDGSKLLYSTYLGGSGADLASDLRVDGQGNVYVLGATSSPNFPTIAAFQPKFGGAFDAFVTKFNRAGAVVYSTYLGGSGEDRGFTGGLDANGNVYVVGRTASADFPIANAFQKTFGGGTYDGYVSKLSPDGRLLYSTYIGGKADDEVSEIDTDPAGNLYVTGTTNSPDFPTMNALQPALGGGVCSSPPRACYDAFVTKLNPDGSALIYSTYLGGSSEENNIGGGVLAVDGLGYAYVGGFTTSPDFPVVDPLQPGLHPGVCGTPPIPCEDGFVAKVSQDGSTLVYSTYLGGSGNDEIWDLKLDGAGNVYVFGQTGSTDFPIASPLQKVYGGGPWDTFLAKVRPASRSIAVSLATMTSPLAPGSLASLLGSSLAQTSAGAPGSLSPPTNLGGVSVRVRDSSGVERFAPLFSVSPKQINFEIPPETATGDATVEVISAQNTLPAVGVSIRSLAPGLLTLKNNMAAAYAVRIEADGAQTILLPGNPIVLDSRPVYLILFGTGIRNRSSLDNVTCTIGGLDVPVSYAGPGGGVAGLDQVNVLLTAALKGKSDGHLILTVDGVVANVVLVDVR